MVGTLSFPSASTGGCTHVCEIRGLARDVEQLLQDVLAVDVATHLLQVWLWCVCVRACVCVCVCVCEREREREREDVECVIVRKRQKKTEQERATRNAIESNKQGSIASLGTCKKAR